MCGGGGVRCGRWPLVANKAWWSARKVGRISMEAERKRSSQARSRIARGRKWRRASTLLGLAIGSSGQRSPRAGSGGGRRWQM